MNSPRVELSQPRPQSNTWSTGLFDFHHDEETCWWGCWCPWLLQARTVHSYDVKSSFYVNFSYCAAIFLCIVLTSVAGGLGLLLSIGIIFWLTYRGAVWRRQIREADGINGDFTSDFLVHCCCSSCAVCQEARQAKISQRPVLDLCSGEDLFSQHDRHEDASVANERGGRLFDHVKSLSQTSKLILGLCGLMFLIAVIGNARKTPLNILVLLLTLLQPFLILYFVYWRNNRAFASLDIVVKLFSVGFWFSTTVAMIIEQILQMVLGGILVLVAGVRLEPTGEEEQPSDPDTGGQMIHHIFRLGINSLSSAFIKVMSPIAAEEDGSPTDGSDSSGPDVDEIRKAMRQNFALVVFGLFIMAFVIAAGVEETVKHFIVRCCQFPAPLKEPKTILIYLMAGALGFATMENIMYVFSMGDGNVNNELTILFMRVLMPIHVICSALQAVNLSKVLVDQQNMSLIMIMLPAICLHGIFDFVLFLLSAISFAYDIQSAGMAVGTFVFAILITISGTCVACWLVRRQQQEHVGGWRRFENQDDFGDMQL